MDYGQLIKDVFTLNFSSMGTRFAKLSGRIMRKLHGEKINEVPVLKIPVIINNRNRYTYLIQLIEWLEDAGMENIIIIDNDSTYPKLLAYYEITRHRVVRLGENVGHLAVWKSTVYDEFKWQHYIYTDPDVVPTSACPKDMPAFLLEQLKKHPAIEKIGLGLKIDDLPEHYNKRNDVIEWERQFWKRVVERGVFDAGVDTTFALYRPYTNGAKWVAPAYRTGEPYMAHHMPWYENSSDPGEENLYYAQHARAGASHWTNKDL